MEEPDKKLEMSKEEFDKAMEMIDAGDSGLRLNNDGEVYVPNRAARRKKPRKARIINIDYIVAPANALTKATHRIKKLRSKNAKKTQYRIRAATLARQASEENNKKVS